MAATQYKRHLPELRSKAEEILRRVLEEDMQLVWMSRERRNVAEVRVEELDADSVEEWRDGCRIELRRVSCRGNTAGRAISGDGGDGRRR